MNHKDNYLNTPRTDVKIDCVGTTIDDMGMFINLCLELERENNELKEELYALKRGEFICKRCKGTGCVDTPFSGSDPCCPDCDGCGVIDTASTTHEESHSPGGKTNDLPEGV